MRSVSPSLTSFMVVLFCSQRHSITLILQPGGQGSAQGWGAVLSLSTCLRTPRKSGAAVPGVVRATTPPRASLGGLPMRGTLPQSLARAARHRASLARSHARLPPPPNQTTPPAFKRPRLAARRPMGQHLEERGGDPGGLPAPSQTRGTTIWVGGGGDEGRGQGGGRALNPLLEEGYMGRRGCLGQKGRTSRMEGQGLREGGCAVRNSQIHKPDSFFSCASSHECTEQAFYNIQLTQVIRW